MRVGARQRRRGDPPDDLAAHLADGRRARVLARLGAARPGHGRQRLLADRAARPRARRPRATSAESQDRPAHAHPPPGRRCAGGRAAAHRARPARRSAGAAGRADAPAGPRRDARRRPARGPAADPRGPARGPSRDRRAARPRARDRSAAARRSRARGGRGVARGALRTRHGGPGATRAAVMPRRSRAPPTSWSPRPSPTRPSTPRRAAAGSVSPTSAGLWSCSWATTAAAAPTREGSGLAGLRARVEALDGSLERRRAPRARGTVVEVSIPCG